MEATTITIEARPVYEFLVSINTFASTKSDKKYDIGQEWFDAIKARASAELLADLTLIPPRCGHGLMGAAYDCPLPRDVPTFLSYLAGIDPLELRLSFIGYYDLLLRREVSLDLIQRAARGEQQAQQQFVLLADSDESYQQALLQLLARDPVEVKQQLLKTLSRWHNEIFRDMEPQIMPILQRDAEAKRLFRQTEQSERFIELATNGYEYIPDPSIREIVLIPTYIGRPYLHKTNYRNTLILQYSVADESISEDIDAPPARLLRLYKALADDRRLRVLKKLSTGSYGLQELADSLGIGKSTLHHHMVTLRSAGLVRLRSSDKRYSLREEVIPGELLAAYLKKDI
jgi:DNA-binding transcriptional ArsR family regulator